MPDPYAQRVESSGLEYLATVDQLLIKQHIEACETILGCETNNRYSVNNSMGQLVSTVSWIHSSSELNNLKFGSFPGLYR